MSSSEEATTSEPGDSSGTVLTLSEPARENGKTGDRDVGAVEEGSREKKHKKKVHIY